MKRRSFLSMGAMGILAALDATADAQFAIEPEPVRNRAYRVRVINEMGTRICVKIIPYVRPTMFHADLADGQSVVQNLYGGHRVMCVWDDTTGDLLIAAGVMVNRHGRLRIRPVASAAFAPALPEDGPADGVRTRVRAAIPAIEIEPE